MNIVWFLYQGNSLTFANLHDLEITQLQRRRRDEWGQGWTCRGRAGGRSPPGVAGGRCSDGAVYILTLLVVTWVYKCDEPTQKHTRTPVYQC